MDKCVPENQFCWTCEPPGQNTTLVDSFAIFPEPDHSPTFQAAMKFVEAGAKGIPPDWNLDMIPGQKWTDNKTNIEVTIPGNDLYKTMGRDPYEDIVLLAKDIGAKGIDLDYEEMWHGVYHYRTESW